MPILKDLIAPNGVQVGFHKVSRLDLAGALTDFVVYVSSWANEDSLRQGFPSAYTWQLGISRSLITSGDLIESVETLLLTEGPFADGQVTILAVDPDSLAAKKQRKDKEINAWRLTANQTYFEYQGKQISCDRLSRSDLDGVANSIALTGSFPVGFPGVWKAIDNSYVSVATTAIFAELYGAMAAKGTANFIHSQGLKTKVLQAQTVEELNSIYWGMDLS